MKVVFLYTSTVSDPFLLIWKRRRYYSGFRLENFTVINLKDICPFMLQKFLLKSLSKSTKPQLGTFVITILYVVFVEESLLFFLFCKGWELYSDRNRSIVLLDSYDILYFYCHVKVSICIYFFRIFSVTVGLFFTYLFLLYTVTNQL